MLHSHSPPSSLRRSLGAFPTSSRNSEEYEALEGLSGSGLKKNYSPAQSSLQDDVVAVVRVIWREKENMAGEVGVINKLMKLIKVKYRNR